MRIDRETAIAAENLLLRISHESGQTVEQFIREVTGAIVSAGDTSSVTDDAETMQKLIDLLASRGYIKILMNPTLEVTDGGTARVSSARKIPTSKAAGTASQADRHKDLVDYIEVTPHIFDSDKIKLLAEGAINIVSPPRDKEQPPAIKSTSFSTEAALKPGWSLIVGGTGAFEDDAGKDTADRQLVDRLVVLTPTIVNSEGTRQDKTDEQIETETAKDQSRTEEQLARSVPVLTMGPKPDGQDKPRFRFDCLVLEIYPSLKMDRESIIAAENLLGEKVAVRRRSR
jgi:type II secretory pathway component GspD/PulD (secretin)